MGNFERLGSIKVIEGSRDEENRVRGRGGALTCEKDERVLKRNDSWS